MSADLLSLSSSLAGLAAGVAPSVVRLSVGHRSIAGFVWREGLIVTSEEMLPDEAEITAHFADGRAAPATLAGRDPGTDVALLRADTGTAPSASFAGGVPALAALVLAIGAGPAAALGLVSHAGGPWRSMRGGEIAARIELDLRLTHRLIGGLAVGPDGAAFGMVTAGPRGAALVIPAETAARAAERLAAEGRVPRGYLGLSLQPVEVAGEGRRGAMVVTVDPDGPAAAAGLRQGDIVVALGETPIGSPRSLLRALGPDSVGQTLALDLRRAGEARTVTLTVAERPAP